MGIENFAAYIDDLKAQCRIIEQQRGLLPIWQFTDVLVAYATTKVGDSIDRYIVQRVASRFVSLRQREERGNIIDWGQEW